jgi:uncharacterized protein (UPF0332 family)
MTTRASQEDYIRYRLEKALKTFEDAKSLAKISSWDSSMNRLYYACFYSVLALFSKHNHNSKTHSGVKTMLSLHYVKTGLLDKDSGLLFGDLFDLRQRGDYGDFFEFEEKDIVPLIPRVEEFLKKIEALINTK